MSESTSTTPATDSDVFVGRWRGLVSTSNWEKGRIIYGWRKSLQDLGAHPGEYSDEVWSRTVGAVTPQHVGRLRRVFERFRTTYSTYEGLYWSHFHAGIDWDDAEMWLEGAVQNHWSVSQMRRQRWKAMGAPEAEQPHDREIVTSEVDEDFEVADPNDPLVSRSVESIENLDKRQAADDDVPPFHPFVEEEAEVDPKSAPAVKPFAELPPLPDDLADAFDSFKLAILRHKVAEWQQVSAEDVIVILESLKLLVTAPSDTGAV